MFKFCCEDCGECWYVGNPRTCKCPDEEPNKKWVGLTDEEIEASKPPLSNDAVVWELAVEWAEAQLKEKNGY